MTLRYGRQALIKYALLAALFGIAGCVLSLSPPSDLLQPLIVRGLTAMFGDGWAALGWFCASLGALGLFVSYRLLASDLTAARATADGLEFNTAFKRAVHDWSEVGSIGVEKRRIRGREHRWLAVEAEGRKRRIPIKLLDAQRLSREGPDIAMEQALAAHVDAAIATAPARPSFGRKGVFE